MRTCKQYGRMGTCNCFQNKVQTDVLVLYQQFNLIKMLLAQEEIPIKCSSLIVDTPAPPRVRLNLRNINDAHNAILQVV